VLEDNAQLGELAVDLAQVREEALLGVEDARALRAKRAASAALLAMRPRLCKVEEKEERLTSPSTSLGTSP